MHSNPVILEMFAYIHHEELQSEAARVRIVRQADRGGPHVRDDLAVTRPRPGIIRSAIGNALSHIALVVRGARIATERR